jgi:hypothetical protein
MSKPMRSVKNDSTQTIRIVVASPNDVLAEREVLPIVIEELNRGIAGDRGMRFELSRWETDTHPGFHPDGPQGLIDPILEITDCDLLIGVCLAGGQKTTLSRRLQGNNSRFFALAVPFYFLEG